MSPPLAALGELDMTLSDIMEVDMPNGEEGGGILNVPSFSADNSWLAAASNSSGVMFIASCISRVAAAMKSGSQCLPRPCSRSTLPTKSIAGLILPLDGGGGVIVGRGGLVGSSFHLLLVTLVGKSAGFRY